MILKTHEVENQEVAGQYVDDYIYPIKTLYLCI